MCIVVSAVSTSAVYRSLTHYSPIFPHYSFTSDDSLLPPDLQLAWNSSNATRRETVRRAFLLVGWYLDQREIVQKYGTKKDAGTSLSQYLPLLSPLLLEEAAEDGDGGTEADPLLAPKRYDYLKEEPGVQSRGSNSMFMG